MFHRKDKLGWVIPSLTLVPAVPAVVCTIVSPVRGILILPMFLGSWLGWAVALAVVYLIFLEVLSWFIPSLEKDPTSLKHRPFYNKIVVSAMGLLSGIGRVRIHLEGEENLPNGRFLLVSNHVSNYDPIVTVWALRKRYVAFISKPGILHIPMVGKMIHTAHFLPIDREDPRKAMTTIQIAAQLIQNDLTSMGIYPEGTRRREGDLLPFHNGVFKIAQKAKVPVVTMVICGTDQIVQHLPWRPTDVTIRICGCIPTEEVISSKTVELSQQVREIMEKNLA